MGQPQVFTSTSISRTIKIKHRCKLVTRDQIEPQQQTCCLLKQDRSRESEGGWRWLLGNGIYWEAADSSLDYLAGRHLSSLSLFWSVCMFVCVLGFLIQEKWNGLDSMPNRAATQFLTGRHFLMTISAGIPKWISHAWKAHSPLQDVPNNYLVLG